MIVGFLLFILCPVWLVSSNPSCPQGKEGMTNVHIVCHTHDDVGWLKTVDQYYYGSRNDITWVGVQYILDSVIPALLKDPSRKFIYVESAFFYRWWQEQDNSTKTFVQTLVDDGRLEFISGGWSMNDEAAAHYNALIDQMTLGLSQLAETFGTSGIPRVAWQIDPFGHSREQASLFAQIGFDGLFVGRIDYDDKVNRWENKNMEMVWIGSDSLGTDAYLFTGVLPNRYSAPAGFCFDLRCGDEPVMDDPDLEGYNKDAKVDEFLLAVAEEQTGYATSNIIMTMGDDFNYMSAETWYTNLDKVIKYVNERQMNGSLVNVMYSTPSCYLDALYAANLTWSTKTDDFFPYASSIHSYWTGYFTSRPTLKGFIRQSNNILQANKQVAALSGLSRDSFAELAESVAVVQHHDAVTGTAKQHVTDDYSKRLARAIYDSNLAVADGFRNLINSSTADFVYCPLLNISQCQFTETSSEFIVSVYNPLGRPVDYYVRIPVENDTQYSITDDEDFDVELQLVPLPDPVMNIPGRESNAQFELVFYAQDVPSLGIRRYRVKTLSAKSSRTQRSKKLRHLSSEDIVVKNDKVSMTFDAETYTLKYMKTERGAKQIQVNQTWLWYAGMPGGTAEQASGAYIFRPDGSPNAFPNVTNITVFEGALVSEIHQEWSSYVTQVLRLYNNLSYVEIDWLVGPIPVQDNVGKEIVNRMTFGDFITNGTFYTDANGREMQTRIKDYRPTWNLLSTEPVSQNYYPVTSRIMLSSVNGQAAVLNDRAQGGTSLADGEMELMVHRRLLYDDGFGVGEALDEKAYGEGLVARGRHFIIHSDMDTPECDFACQHRTLGEQLLLQPILLFSPATSNDGQVLTQFSGLDSPLPDNIHLLTLEPWDDGKWLLRLENFYEKDESIKSGTSSVNIKNMFAGWTVTNIEEMTLAANQLKSDNVRLQWNINSNEAVWSSPKEDYALPFLNYSLDPMQIRTFIIDVTPM